MGRSQRNKGAAYERELAAIFSLHFGTKITRKLGQARDSGNDLDAGPFVVEAKRRKSLKTQMGWYRQAQAATPKGRIPIVVMREDNGPNMVLISLDDLLRIRAEAVV